MSFINYLTVAPFVIFFFGFCIFIHELGHFLVAKWRGLHIIAFSIGFKKIWGFKYKGVDYRIGCIPCGGYVDLPQIDATGEPKDENGNPLPRAKPIDKILTALAGPLFNILFGIVLGTAVWIWGVPETTPHMNQIEVKKIYKYSPEYKAGLRKGDIITAVNGKHFNATWNDFVRDIFFTVGKVTLDVKRGDKNLKITYTPKPNEIRTPREKIAYPFFSPVIPLQCSIVPGSPADKAGMKTGDIITKVDGKKITGLNHFDLILRKNRGETLNFTVMRNGKEVKIAPIKPVMHSLGKKQIGVQLGYVLVGKINTVTNPPEQNKSEKKQSESTIVKQGEGKKENLFQPGDQIIKIGNAPLGTQLTINEVIYKAEEKPLTFLIKRGDKEPLKVTALFPLDTKTKKKTSSLSINYKYNKHQICALMVFPGSPAEKAGLKEYDKLLKINGQPVTTAQSFINAVNDAQGKPITLEIERNTKISTVTITPEESYALGDIGVQMTWSAHPSPWQQFVKVIDMTYKSLRGIVSRDSTLKARHLSGPIGIFRGLAMTYYHGGLMKAIALLVLITYSLAILNIMPLPVLDGGHIVLAVIEQIRGGKPLPAKLIQPIFVIFIVFLMSMMLYVSFFDTMRMTSVNKEYKFIPAQPEQPVQPEQSVHPEKKKE
jgi:regulator of sigma E protease